MKRLSKRADYLFDESAGLTFHLLVTTCVYHLSGHQIYLYIFQVSRIIDSRLLFVNAGDGDDDDGHHPSNKLFAFQLSELKRNCFL